MFSLKYSYINFDNVNLYFNFFSLKISSPNGIRIIEFRDSCGTSFHHIEYPEDTDTLEVDLALQDILKHTPDKTNGISFIAEDGVGNIFKSKLRVSELS